MNAHSTQRCWIALTVVVAIVGCDAENPRADRAAPLPAPAASVDAFEVMDSAGVQIVTNHAPRVEGGLDWRIDPAPTLRIGGEDPEVGHLIWRVMDVARLSDGKIAALVGGQTSPRIVVLDREGRLVRTIGGPGQGPGEFIEPIHLQHLPGDTLVTWERHFGRVTYFDAMGNVLRTRHLDLGRLRPGMSFDGGAARLRFGLPEGAFIVSARRDRTPMSERAVGTTIRDTVAYLRVNSDYSADTLGFYAGSEEYTVVGSDGQPTQGQLLISRDSGVSAGGNPLRIAVGTGDPIEGFHVFDDDGRLERIVRSTAPEMPLDQQDRHDLIDLLVRVSNLPEERQVSAREGMDRTYPSLDHFPSFGAPHLDAQNHFWMADRYLTVDRPFVFSIFDPDGVWVGHVQLDVRGQVKEIGRDYVLMYVVDELGIEYIQEHALTRGAAAGDG